MTETFRPVGAGHVRVLGVDPGFASTGVALVDFDPRGVAHVLVGEVVRTQPTARKQMQHLRVSADDQRRVQEIWVRLDAIAAEEGITAVAVEAFRPFVTRRKPGASGGDGGGEEMGMGGGNAWKTGIVYGLILGFAHHLGVPCFVFLPQDLKRLAGSATASKSDVGRVVVRQVQGLEAVLSTVRAKTLHEHLTDAAGLAILGSLEMTRMRSLMGGASSVPRG